MKRQLSIKAFTIMEIMIVVIIVGIIAAFAIPNYSRSVSQSHLQDAMMQLSAIRSANQVYYARTSKYWPATAAANNVTAINSFLSLNIIENAMTYSCTGIASGATFNCTATPVGSAYTVTVTQNVLSSTNPTCGGTCP